MTPKDIILIKRNLARGVATMTSVDDSEAFTVDHARTVGLEAQRWLDLDVVVTDYKMAYRCRRRNVMEVEVPNFRVRLRPKKQPVVFNVEGF